MVAKMRTQHALIYPQRSRGLDGSTTCQTLTWVQLFVSHFCLVLDVVHFLFWDSTFNLCFWSVFHFLSLFIWPPICASPVSALPYQLPACMSFLTCVLLPDEFILYFSSHAHPFAKDQLLQGQSSTWSGVYIVVCVSNFRLDLYPLIVCLGHTESIVLVFLYICTRGGIMCQNVLEEKIMKYIER